MTHFNILSAHPSLHVNYKTVLVFGSKTDRVIETAGIINDGTGAFEVGYYNGATKSKAIINISPALGCPVGCNFCELTDSGRNLSATEMVNQVLFMANTAVTIDDVDLDHQGLKINIAKTGDPVFNPHMVEFMQNLPALFPRVSFKYSTVMPDVSFLMERVQNIARHASTYKDGSLQLQISLISTNEIFRRASARARLAPLASIRGAVDAWRNANPEGRVPNASLLVGADTPCDPNEIKDVLPPDLIYLRVRPIIPTRHSRASGIRDATTAVVDAIVNKFRDAGYTISTAGVPTPTESKHNLASNVTRQNLLGGTYEDGLVFL